MNLEPTEIFQVGSCPKDETVTLTFPNPSVTIPGTEFVMLVGMLTRLAMHIAAVFGSEEASCDRLGRGTEDCGEEDCPWSILTDKDTEKAIAEIEKLANNL